MPLENIYISQNAFCDLPEMGFSIQERAETKPVLLPGYKSQQVLIMEMIEANQILRDHVMYYRDELVRQAEDHRKSIAVLKMGYDNLLFASKPPKKSRKKKMSARRKK